MVLFSDSYPVTAHPHPKVAGLNRRGSLRFKVGRRKPNAVQLMLCFQGGAKRKRWIQLIAPVNGGSAALDPPYMIQGFTN